MAKFASRAEELRHHRKCFEAALEWGCTPKEAETWLSVIELRERQRARAETLRARFTLQPMAEPRPRAFEQFDAPWMMRD